MALLDMMVGCGLIATFAIAFATVFGMRPVRTHSAAVSLEMALAEARNLAAANTNITDTAYPSGATVVVEDDPQIRGASRIAVYRSRPVNFGSKNLFAPPRDGGFPPARVAGHFQFNGGGSSIQQPFEIMISGAGYVSIQYLGAHATYDENNPTFWTSDPGCKADGAEIEVIDGASTEAHPFGCAGATYHAN